MNLAANYAASYAASYVAGSNPDVPEVDIYAKYFFLLFLIAIIPHIVLPCVDNTPDNKDILFGCELGFGLLFLGLMGFLIYFSITFSVKPFPIICILVQIGLTIGLSYYIKTYESVPKTQGPTGTDLYNCVNNKTKEKSLYIFSSFISLIYASLLLLAISDILVDNGYKKINLFFPDPETVGPNLLILTSICWFAVLIIVIISGIILLVSPVTNLVTLVKFATNTHIYNSANVATTEPIIISSTKPGTVIDNVILNLDDVILVKNQLDKSENGLYTVKETSLIRAPNATTDKKANDFVVSVLNGLQKGHWKVKKSDQDIYFGQPIIFEADIVYIDDCKAS